MDLTLGDLKKFVHEFGAAIRVRQNLQPGSGEGGKIFPPTYSRSEKDDSQLKYAMEKRRDGESLTESVLLSSVAGQANRIEDALREAWESREIDFPVMGVDFTVDPELAEIGVVTTLDAPHRIGDAIFRDSVDTSGTLFRETAQGKAYTDASPKNATAVYRLCPTAILLGVWDSTGPRGGMGNKFARLLVSEIVGMDAQVGVKVSSRLDPLKIQANVDIYAREDDPNDWTLEESEALKVNGTPVLFSRKSGDGKKKGKASSINHSNQPPSIDTTSGGVTISRAEHISVLSLAGLRKIKFLKNVKGDSLSGEDRIRGEQAARLALAALGLIGILAERRTGYDLRSRCLLVPEGPMQLEIVDVDGAISQVSLSWEGAKKLLVEATKEAEAVGFGWEREPMSLRPVPKLLDLVKRSRALSFAGKLDESEGGE